MFSHPTKNVDELDIQPGMKVADIGSGIGHYSLAVAKKVGPKGIVYAIDIQKDLLAKLKSDAKYENIKNIEMLWGDVEKLHGSHLKDDYIDRAVISNILFQIEHKDIFCAEVKRILVSGAKALIIDWSSIRGIGPHMNHLFSEAKAKELFESHGFIIEKSFDAGNHHYGLIVQKR
jgi:ubiquinone/menaquinone biosynthesis C-methylase UbiE